MFLTLYLGWWRRRRFWLRVLVDKDRNQMQSLNHLCCCWSLEALLQAIQCDLSPFHRHWFVTHKSGSVFCSDVNHEPEQEIPLVSQWTLWSANIITLFIPPSSSSSIFSDSSTAWFDSIPSIQNKNTSTEHRTSANHWSVETTPQADQSAVPATPLQTNRCRYCSGISSCSNTLGLHTHLSIPSPYWYRCCCNVRLYH